MFYKKYFGTGKSHSYGHHRGVYPEQSRRVTHLYGKPLFSFSCLVYRLCMFAVLFFTSCSTSIKKADNKEVTAKDLFVDTTIIPRDTVLETNAAFSYKNGLFYFNQRLYSGIALVANSDKTIKAFCSVYNGMRHGIYRSYYSNGRLFEVRQYKNDLATGRHFGYFDNGNMQFDYLYFEEQKVGHFKKWYRTGKPYLFANYKDDAEDGLQQGWRPNGKLFLNYVAKDGRTYGLQETMLCYTLTDEELKETAIKK